MAKKINFEKINQLALGNFESLLRQWLPDGKKSGAEYGSVNPTRNDGHAGSFSVNIYKGVWQDFATGEGGSDPISLFAYLFHGNDQGKAAKDLAEMLGVGSVEFKPVPVKKDKTPRTLWQQVIPPENAPPPHKAHLVRGLPERLWCYRGAEGNALGYMYRFTNSSGGKEILPLSWCKNLQTGAEEWRWISFADPRWLYGLDRLHDKPTAPVLIVEGEKCADVAAEQLPHMACISWPGGSKAINKVDWLPLAGRDVVIWPDCDAQSDKAGVLLPEDKQPGLLAAAQIAKFLQVHGCRVWQLAIPKPAEKVSGWDIADAVTEGLVGEELKAFIRGQARPLATAGSADKAASAQPADAECPDYRHRAAWEQGLLEKPRGGLEDCRENVFLVLSQHPAWLGVIGFNEFTQRVEKIKPAPYGGELGEWQAVDDNFTGLWLAQHCDLLLRSESTIVAGVAMVASKNNFHPVRDWLAALPEWDGVNRLEHFIAECVGCGNSRYIQLVGKYFMIGMVARILRPGCKMQYMPVLEGAQGLGKSNLWRTLVSPAWFQDSPLDLGDKDAYMNLAGAVLYEIAEMDSFNKSEATKVKGFITQEVDRYREPYARRISDHPRQVVFAGTTNHGEYLKDTTGNRRFWPIKAEFVDDALLLSIRVQLFAEALQRFKAGERWHPEREEEKEHFIPEQDARRIVDPWLYPLQDWLNDSDQRYNNEFTVTELLIGAMKVELNKIDGNRGMSTRMGNLMAELDGWTRKRRSTGKREWVYVRPETERVAFKAGNY